MKDNSTSLVKLKIREMEERMLSSESEIIKFQSKNIAEVQKVYSSYQPCDIRNSVVLYPRSYKIHKRGNSLTEFYRVYDKNELESIFYSLIDKKNDVLVSLNLFYEGSSDFFTDFLPLLKVSSKDLFVFLSMLKNRDCYDMFLFLDDDFVVNISYLDDECGKGHYNFTSNKEGLNVLSGQ